MRRQIPYEVWEQARIAFASGSIGLRALARKLDIPPGTICARASRERWTGKIAIAKRALANENALVANPTVLQAVELSIRERAQRYTSDMADVSERVVPHLKKMHPGKILDNARNLEQFDRVARRNFGLEGQSSTGGPLTLNLLATHSAVKIVTAGQT